MRREMHSIGDELSEKSFGRKFWRRVQRGL